MTEILKNPGDVCVIDTSAARKASDGAGVPLAADGSGADENVVKISLDWSHEEPGFLKRLLGKGAVDLDLGCYYRLRDGRRAVIDGLQFSNNEGGPRDRRTLQGCFDYMPYIWHTGDNTGMDSEASETILVNPEGLAKIKCMMVYCFIYEGIARWSDTDAVLRISFPGNPVVEVQVGSHKSDKRFCLVAALDFGDDGRITVRRMAEFYDNHSAAGSAHGWDLKFTPGYK